MLSPLLKKSRIVIAFGLGCVALSGLARAQTYYFTGSVGGFQNQGNGYQEVPFADGDNPNANGGGKFPGFSFNCEFSAISGLLIYNQQAGTMQMQGSVNVSMSAFNGGFNDDQKVNGNSVSASVSVNAVLANVNNGVWTFNTGPVQHTDFASDTWNMNIPMPISGTCSLTTGGQNYGGSYNGTIDIPTTLKLINLSSSDLTFAQDTLQGSDNGGGHLTDVNAANGAHLGLASTDPSDGSSYVQWHLDGIDATVPEPGSFGILAGGLLGLLLLRRHRSASPGKSGHFAK